MDESVTMEKHEITLEDLERMATAMAHAIPDLECPECCTVELRHHYVELSAALYQDEWEWACFATALAQYRAQRKANGSGSS
jgi:hypothetical protein